MDNEKNTPVLILNCQIGALAIMRSLGSLGVTLYGVDDDKNAPAFASRYCRGKYVKALDEQRPQEYLDFVIRIGKQLEKKAILIPTSDELSVFVAEYADKLSEYFLFPRNDLRLVKDLMSKEGMYALATRHWVPTAFTVFPRTLRDVQEYADGGAFPVMLKGILGNRLQARTGVKMMIVHTKEELVEAYKELEDPDQPNLMIQEYIPGGDDQIYIFNGYFNEQSECLAGFTGHKIRQFPVHVGCASLGICKWNQEVADITTAFMKTVGYKGILDIGYRLDPRNGKYKVLDINPRVGQAFRLFVAEDGMDVVRALYKDLTGQLVLKRPPREGRKWVIENYDIVSSLHYYQEGSLGIGDWLRSFKGVEEGAWFSWKDPMPFILMTARLLKKSAVWLGKRRTRANKNTDSQKHRQKTHDKDSSH
jgi:predicted ATP-grasp superfamily ATP-dependent carboligase